MHDIDEWKGAKGCFCLDGYMRDTGPDILHYTLIMSEYYNIYNNISQYTMSIVKYNNVYLCIDFHACMRAPGPVSGSSERSFLPPFW